MFMCKNHDCVFFKEYACVIPEDKNFNLSDEEGDFHCINYITDVNQVCKEARRKYNL